MKQRIKRKILKAYRQWNLIIFKITIDAPISWKEVQFKLRYPKWKIDKAQREWKTKAKTKRR